MLTIVDNTQPITLWHHQVNITTGVPLALIRRYRHRRYSQVVDSPIPVNYAHWYFSLPMESASEASHPIPGDEIRESNGTVWTILEVNFAPLTGLWQAVCETFAFAKPTEFVDHYRQLEGAVMLVRSSLPVRIGVHTTILEPEVSRRLTFYVRDSLDAMQDDIFVRSNDTHWKIVRVDRPQYRERWTTVATREE
jgi:hypothetical protein